jgi:hypothetical protein
MNAMLGPQCYTCRKRQVRCDSNTPACLRCQRDLRECRGYQRPLKFVVYKTPQDTQPKEPPPVAEPQHGAENRKNYPLSVTELPLCKPLINGDRLVIGSGQRRYKFLSQSTAGVELKQSLSPKPKYDVISPLALPKTPQTAFSSLKAALLKAIRPTTDFRFNLAWTHGDFFELMPQRIGINSALDSALETLVSAHSDVCLGYRSTQIGTLVLHTRALQSLRHCLNNPWTADTTETLGAVLVLLTLQVRLLPFLGSQWQC